MIDWIPYFKNILVKENSTELKQAFTHIKRIKKEVFMIYNLSKKENMNKIKDIIKKLSYLKVKKLKISTKEISIWKHNK